jgi:tetratricopeptide (TPR) repeat protein
MEIKRIKFAVILLSMVMVFLILAGNSYTNGIAQSKTPVGQLERPIFGEALKAYGQKNYKVARELGLKSAKLEGNNDNSFLSFIYSWVARIDCINGNVEQAIENLEKAVSFGYGQEGELTELVGDPQFKILYQHPKWNGLVEATRKNSLEQAKLNKDKPEIQSNGDNPQIQLIFKEDQADRNQIPTIEKENPAIIKQAMLAQFTADENRLNQMKLLVKANKLKTPNDYHAASVVFHHSGKIADIKMANELARRGYDLTTDDNEKCNFGWLIAATTDRYLWSQGKPQIYGTQSRPTNISLAEFLEMKKAYIKALENKDNAVIDLPMPIQGNSMTLEPIDKAKLTDEERRKLCVPPIKN